MENKEIKEMLEKQMKLLSKQSENHGMPLVEAAYAMCELANTIQKFTSICK